MLQCTIGAFVDFIHKQQMKRQNKKQKEGEGGEGKKKEGRKLNQIFDHEKNKKKIEFAICLP